MDVFFGKNSFQSWLGFDEVCCRVFASQNFQNTDVFWSTHNAFFLSACRVKAELHLAVCVQRILTRKNGTNASNVCWADLAIYASGHFSICRKIETWSIFLAYHAFSVFFCGWFTMPNVHTNKKNTQTQSHNARCDSALRWSGDRWKEPSHLFHFGIWNFVVPLHTVPMLSQSENLDLDNFAQWPSLFSSVFSCCFPFIRSRKV